MIVPQSYAGAIAFAFPGMGAKPCGHEAEFYRRHATHFAPFLERVSPPAGVDCTAALLCGSLAALSDRQSQLFTYAFSAGVNAVLAAAGVRPGMVAGYSFGIYSALLAAGAVSFDDGLRMVTTAYALMAEACAGRDTGMAAVVGLGEDDLAAAVRDANAQSVRVVNVNNDACRVLAGPRRELASVLDAALARDAFKAQFLPVDIAYHHPHFLAAITPRFRHAIAQMAWSPPAVPLLSSADQSLVATTEGLIDCAVANLATPLDWAATLTAMHAAGVAQVVECGPGLSLTQNARFMPFAMPFTNLKNMQRRLGL